MSSENSSQPGAQTPNEDWLQHKLSFNPLPLNLINPFSRNTEGTSENRPASSSWVPPAQWQSQLSRPSNDVVGTSSETRKTRCISLSGLDALKGKLKNSKWAQASPPALEDEVPHNPKAPSDTIESPESDLAGPSTIRDSIETGAPRFLGRHPPPIQRRSTSLPRIDETKPPHPNPLRCHPVNSERPVRVGSYYDRRSVWKPNPLRLNPTRPDSPVRVTSPPRRVSNELLLAGPSKQTRPGHKQVARYVPIMILPNTPFEITSFSTRNTDDMMDFQIAESIAYGIESTRATRTTSDELAPNATLPFCDDGGKYAKSKLRQKIEDTKIVKNIYDKGAKLHDKASTLWMYVKVTLKNHGWYYGDDGFEGWLDVVHGAEETYETGEETN